MGWIKRNLFFLIGGVIALVLLGGAGFYTYTSWQRNNAALDKLNKIYTTLKENNSKKPLPGKDGSNIKLAQEQEQKLREWMNGARNHFNPIAPIPSPANGQLTPQLFGDTLSRTIARLQSEAATAGVSLPPAYSFSFQAEHGAVKFAPGSLKPLSEQVGAVAAISEILFSAHINGLEGIQRIRVSDDDKAGQQNDYLDELSYSNNLAVLTPYRVTFLAFTPEIAQVLIAFATSPHGTIVRTINVQPASGATTTGGRTSGMSPSAFPPTAGRSGGGALPFLNEQKLRVTMVIEIVKLAPTN